MVPVRSQSQGAVSNRKVLANHMPLPIRVSLVRSGWPRFVGDVQSQHAATLALHLDDLELHTIRTLEEADASAIARDHLL